MQRLYFRGYHKNLVLPGSDVLKRFRANIVGGSARQKLSPDIGHQCGPRGLTLELKHLPRNYSSSSSSSPSKKSSSVAVAAFSSVGHASK